MKTMTIEGYVENGLFFPAQKISWIKERTNATLTLAAPVEFERIVEKTEEELEEIRQLRLSGLGSMNGKIWMSEDFDAPLEEFEEYM